MKRALTTAAHDYTLQAGRARTSYTRPLNNALWGFTAGVAQTKMQRLLSQKACSYADAGIKSAVAAVIGGELRAFVSGGELW